MNCFNHEGKIVTAVCKVCGRAICKDCSLESGIGMVCKDKCEAKAQKLHKIQVMSEKSIESYESVIDVSNKRRSVASAFSIILGILFIAFGYIFSNDWNDPFAVLLIIMGIIVAISGIWSLGKKYTYPK